MRETILLDALRMAIIDACNNWREENDRQTIPASAFLVIANAVAEKLQKELPESGGEEKADSYASKMVCKKEDFWDEDDYRKYETLKNAFVAGVQSCGVTQSEGKDEYEMKGYPQKEKELMETKIVLLEKINEQQAAEIERLTAENEGNKTIAIERGKGIEELQGEIERLTRLLKIWFYKAHNYMETSQRRDEVWQQFQKENGLKEE